VKRAIASLDLPVAINTMNEMRRPMDTMGSCPAQTIDRLLKIVCTCLYCIHDLSAIESDQRNSKNLRHNLFEELDSQLSKLSKKIRRIIVEDARC